MRFIFLVGLLVAAAYIGTPYAPTVRDVEVDSFGDPWTFPDIIEFMQSKGIDVSYAQRPVLRGEFDWGFEDVQPIPGQVVVAELRVGADDYVAVYVYADTNARLASWGPVGDGVTVEPDLFITDQVFVAAQNVVFHASAWSLPDLEGRSIYALATELSEERPCASC